MTYDEITEEIKLLVEAEEWLMLRTYFSYWEDRKEQVFKTIAWGRFFLPQYFRDVTPPFHYELVADIFALDNSFIAAPRGFSKTTINQLCICFQIVNKLEKFIVIIEKTYDEASEVIKGIADSFRDNSMIKQVYGDLVKMGDSGSFSDKNSDSFGDVVINGVRLRAKGFNTTVRGLKDGAWRPTIIYCDDVESDEHINSEEQRKKYRENYSQGIVPAIDVTGRIKFRGTILHNDSLLKNLIDQFKGKIFQSFDDTKQDLFLNGTLEPKDLLWAERWSQELLLKKKDEMEMQGKGSSKFWQEFQNNPIDDEFRTFHWEWLQKEFVDDDLKFKVYNRFAMIDVAESKNAGADFTGKVVIDWDSQNNWFLHKVKRQKVNIIGLIDLIFETWQVDKPLVIGIEKKAFEDQIKPLLKQRSEETGIFPVVVELEHGGKRKEDRIKGALSGRFEMGKVYFKKNAKDDQGLLRSELYDFPSSKNDDLSDAMAYIEQIGYRPLGGDKEVDTSIEAEFYRNKQKQSITSRIRNL